MPSDKMVHHTRLTFSHLPDDPVLVTGYLVQMRLVEQDDWATYGNVALASPAHFALAAAEAIEVVYDAATTLPRVLPFE